MSTSFLYPPTPESVPVSITAPSAAFKKEVTDVMGSIIFFFIVYFLLLIFSVGLVIGCFYAGYYIIVSMPRLITILAGLGLVGVGVMVFVFLVKFIFSVSRYDRSGIIEIKEADQPALFGFIRQLTKDTQTQFPRKIYISPDVNACVFYDSSFWSMFLPVKKNLQIGLGLVNAVNVSEFKAVMAHEFGHFSQRSMKLGSFVYHVNKIIYNMLFDNRGYSSFLQSWANIDGVFAFFAGITAGIAQGIQGLLKQMYGFINKKYMSLSRQMEFHADAVAASVSGSESLGTALRRIELASSGYDLTLGKCAELLKDKKVSTNIYSNHKSVMLQLAKEYDLPLRSGLPEVRDEFLKSMNFSRVNVKDQWASHPSTDDRIRHLSELAVAAPVFEQPAWELFLQREELQQLLTQKIYEPAGELAAAGSTLAENEFDRKLEKEIEKNTFPAVYNGFYDNRQITVPGNGEITGHPVPADITFESLFSEENALLVKKINAAANDLELVKAISEKRIDARSFDFDGEKYERDDAALVIEKLEEELQEMKFRQENADMNAVRLFLENAGRKSETGAQKLKEEYNNYFKLRLEAASYLEKMNRMLEPLQQIYEGQAVQLEEITTLIGHLKETSEPVFKKDLATWEEQGTFAGNPVLKDRVDKFIASNYVYFQEKSFIETELAELHDLCNESWTAVNSFIFEKFRLILEQQLPYRN